MKLSNSDIFMVSSEKRTYLLKNVRA